MKFKTQLKPTAAVMGKGKKGFSLPSVIVGSIIAAVLGTVAVSSMWGSVDKAKIAAEKSTISEMKTTAHGVLESVGGFPVQMSTTEDTAAISKVSNLPTELKYKLVLVQNGTTATSDDYMVLKAHAETATGLVHIKNLVNDLDADLNGTAVGNDTAGAKFAYNTTCTDTTPADGIADTPLEDCYYIAYVTAKGAAPSTISGADETGTAAGNEIDGATALPAANSVSPLN